VTDHTTVHTPADLTVVATCPTCEEPTAIRMQIGAELLVTDDGSELRIKGKSKGVAHICGQLPLMGLDHEATEVTLERADLPDRIVDAMVDAVEGEADVAAPLRELAERTGTDITIEAQGRTATIHGRRRFVDPETGEILETETADETLRRLEREPDYVERMGTDDGQALLAAAAREADEARRKAALS
jgi:hypothetical protein